MVIDATITEKSFGPKELLKNVHISIAESEKIGLIGRNGIGKSTLLNILMGRDTDFTGEIIARKGATLVSTDQEYAGVAGKTVLEYILAGLPEYSELHKIINDFIEVESPKYGQIKEYSEALERFGVKGFYEVEEKVKEELKNFQLEGFSERKMSTLSGGQKRLIEVVKIMHASADLAIIDEPTNLMDYVAKNQFTKWLKAAPEALLIITHDRDVLKEVDRIIEIKDGESFNYSGNYEAYLMQNATKTSTGMNEYEITQRKIENLKKQVAYARSKKASWGGTADKKNPFVVMETRALKEIKKLETVEKPSFWIDKTSAENLNYKDASRYDKYKAKNVRIALNSKDSKARNVIVKAVGLSLGYDSPLFDGKTFELSAAGSLEFRGRNGAGKTTLIKAILNAKNGVKGVPSIFAGELLVDQSVRVGVYEQEVSTELFELTLEQALYKIYADKSVNLTPTQTHKLLAAYLFTTSDKDILVKSLSGGQKARLQIIKMLVDDPNLLILDEPTSHLDLPSIEELESALKKYSGAIIYVSHDNYFQRSIPATVVHM